MGRLSIVVPCCCIKECYSTLSAKAMLDHLVSSEHISALLTLHAKMQEEVVELLLPTSRDIVITCVVECLQGVSTMIARFARPPIGQ